MERATYLVPFWTIYHLPSMYVVLPTWHRISKRRWREWVCRSSTTVNSFGMLWAHPTPLKTKGLVDAESGEEFDEVLLNIGSSVGQARSKILYNEAIPVWVVLSISCKGGVQFDDCPHFRKCRPWEFTTIFHYQFKWELNRVIKQALHYKERNWDNSVMRCWLW